MRFGGDFIFGSAVWQIAQAHSAHAPTHVYRYDYATRALRWSGMGATHATELLAIFDVYRSRFGRLLAAGIDSRTALKVSDDVQRRWLNFAENGGRRATTGRSTVATGVRSWCSTAVAASSTIRMPSVGWPGRTSSLRLADADRLGQSLCHPPGGM